MKTKLSILLVLLVTSGIWIYGFSAGDNPYQKTYSQAPENAPKVVFGPALDAPLSALSESFEGTFPPAGWAKFSPLGRTGWEKQTFGTTPIPGFLGGSITTPTGGGSACAFVTYTSSAQNIEWLMTPQITNVQPDDSLKFWLRFWPEQYPDSFLVKVSTTTQTVAAMTTTLWAKRFNGAADSGWMQFKFRMGSTVPAGSNIYLGFLESFNDGASFSLDLVNYTPAAAPPPSPTTWFEQTTPVTGTLSSISAANDNAVWSVGYVSNTAGPPLVVRTTNGGTWTLALGTGIGATVPLFNVWAIDANTALVTGSNATASYIYKTTDGGLTWTTVFTQTGGFIDGIVMKDATNGIMYGDPVPAAGGRWTIFRTTNAGNTWDSTGCYLPQTGSEAGWNNDMCVVGNNVWFGTNNTKCYYSSNFGSNWTAQATGEAGTSGSEVYFNNATTGLYGGAALKLTTNSGTNWNTNAGTGTGNFSGITGDGGNSFWTVRFSAAIGYSSNNGSTWSTAYTTTAGTVNHITRSRTGLLLYGCKSNGQIVKYGVTTGVTPVSNVVDNYALSQNYPNPFNPTTNIKFAIPQSGFVTLKVYNMLGKEVASLVNGNLTAGSYDIDFNALTLSSGIYFYRLESGNFVETKKMMLIK